MKVQIVEPDMNCLNKILYARNICKGKSSNLSPKSQIQGLFKSGHLSVLEHGMAMFAIENISRVTSHQLVRHRLMSFTQESNRAVPAHLQPTVVPPTIMGLINEGIDGPNSIPAMLFREYQQAFTKWVGYLKAHNILDQDIRYFTPHGTETALQVSGNFRNWIHFILLRNDSSAQWEIRELAHRIYLQLNKVYPVIFNETNLELIKYAPAWKSRTSDQLTWFKSIDVFLPVEKS